MRQPVKPARLALSSGADHDACPCSSDRKSAGFTASPNRREAVSMLGRCWTIPFPGGIRS
ncbi:MAG TPA: hypothetical protein PK708_02995 [Candidatus Competibacter sp.]|nr:hypothetical protein [Candidatus Competibacter sp.]